MLLCSFLDSSYGSLQFMRRPDCATGQGSLWHRHEDPDPRRESLYDPWSKWCGTERGLHTTAKMSPLWLRFPQFFIEKEREFGIKTPCHGLVEGTSVQIHKKSILWNSPILSIWFSDFYYVGYTSIKFLKYYLKNLYCRRFSSWRMDPP